MAPRRSRRRSGIKSPLGSIFRTPKKLGKVTKDAEDKPAFQDLINQQIETLLPEIVSQVSAQMTSTTPANGARSGWDGSKGCSYKDFSVCKPKEYDGKGGSLVLVRCVEKMESVFDISGCSEAQKVKFAASVLVNKALTWWNTQLQARGREAATGMSWEDFKALMLEEFCPSNEMQKLEEEFWNHAMVGAKHAVH